MYRFNEFNAVRLYLKEIDGDEFEPLPRQLEEQLFAEKEFLERQSKQTKAMQRRLDQIRDIILKANTRFVLSEVKKIAGDEWTEQFQELLSAGNYGLVTAYADYKFHKGTKFISYAMHHLKKEFANRLDADLTIRLARSRIDVRNRATKIRKEVEQTLGRRVTHREVYDCWTQLAESEKYYATLLPASFDEYLLSLEYTQSTLSLNFAIPIVVNADEPEFYVEMVENIPDEHPLIDEQLCLAERNRIIARCVQNIKDDKDRQAIRYYFGFDGPPITLEEAGVLMGCTRERVRQRKTRALEQLRDFCLTDPVFIELVRGQQITAKAQERQAYLQKLGASNSLEELLRFKGFESIEELKAFSNLKGFQKLREYHSTEKKRKIAEILRLAKAKAKSQQAHKKDKEIQEQQIETEEQQVVTKLHHRMQEAEERKQVRERQQIERERKAEERKRVREYQRAERERKAEKRKQEREAKRRQKAAMAKRREEKRRKKFMTKWVEQRKKKEKSRAAQEPFRPQESQEILVSNSPTQEGFLKSKDVEGGGFLKSRDVETCRKAAISADLEKLHLMREATHQRHALEQKELGEDPDIDVLQSMKERHEREIKELDRAQERLDRDQLLKVYIAEVLFVIDSDNINLHVTYTRSQSNSLEVYKTLNMRSFIKHMNDIAYKALCTHWAVTNDPVLYSVLDLKSKWQGGIKIVEGSIQEIAHRTSTDERLPMRLFSSIEQHFAKLQQSVYLLEEKRVISAKE